jgi:hypothetical protein
MQNEFSICHFFNQLSFQIVAQLMMDAIMINHLVYSFTEWNLEDS